MLSAQVAAAVDELLAEAQELGLVGPAPVHQHRRHAEVFVTALRPAHRLLDLGSGGGLPGLVVAGALPESEVVLLDARERRTDFLRRAVGRLGWTDRVHVVTGRAERLAHEDTWRSRFDAVVARGFGAPGVTAECAAGFLRVGGQLVVSEPPDDRSVEARWPSAPLRRLGLGLDGSAPDRAAVRSLTQASLCPARFPPASILVPLF